MCVSLKIYELWTQSPDKSIAETVLFKCDLNGAAIQMYWPIKRQRRFQMYMWNICRGGNEHPLLHLLHLTFFFSQASLLILCLSLFSEAWQMALYVDCTPGLYCMCVCEFVCSTVASREGHSSAFIIPSHSVSF